MIEAMTKLAVVAVALGIWFATQRWIAALEGGTKGIGDMVHRWTRGIHRSLVRNPKAADRLLIGSSFCIDALGISMIALALFGPTFRPFLAILLVFALRQISQLCCTLPPPPGMIWRNPGVPSLLVTYGVGNDFFFSGHTALAVLGAIEISRIAPPWLGAVCMFVALGEAIVVLLLRAHYTMDVITGALAACLAAHLAGRLAPPVDDWIRAISCI